MSFFSVVIQDKQIAILFFSRSAKAEAKYKHWLKGYHQNQNRAFAQFLIGKSKSAIAKSGLPVFHSHEGNQVGRTFGEKIANAFQSIFDLGYQSVICVGNDAPHSSIIDWNALCQKLKEGKSIVGPDLRGGAYLIALNSEQFQKERFQELPWKTDGLFQSLTQHLNAHHILPKAADLNTWVDVQKARKLLSAFRRFLFNLLNSIPKSDHLIPVTIKSRTSPSGLRAPPVFR